MHCFSITAGSRILILSALFLNEGFGASISGVASDASGAVQGTVVITFTRTTPAVAPPGGGDAGPQTGASGLATDGTFSFPNLGIGTYALCVQGGGHSYADGCPWGTPRLVEIRRANENVNVTLALERGVRVQVLVSDAKRLLRKAGRPGAAGQIEVGVWMKNGMYQPLAAPRQDDQSATWDVVLPKGDYFHVKMRPQGVRLRDKANAAVPDFLLSVPVVTKDWPGSPAGGAVSAVSPAGTASTPADLVLEYSTDVEGN